MEGRGGQVLLKFFSVYQVESRAQKRNVPTKISVSDSTLFSPFLTLLLGQCWDFSLFQTNNPSYFTILDCSPFSFSVLDTKGQFLYLLKHRLNVKPVWVLNLEVAILLHICWHGKSVIRESKSSSRRVNELRILEVLLCSSVITCLYFMRYTTRFRHNTLRIL